MLVLGYLCRACWYLFSRFLYGCRLVEDKPISGLLKDLSIVTLERMTGVPFCCISSRSFFFEGLKLTNLIAFFSSVKYPWKYCFFFPCFIGDTAEMTPCTFALMPLLMELISERSSKLRGRLREKCSDIVE